MDAVVSPDGTVFEGEGQARDLRLSAMADDPALPVFERARHCGCPADLLERELEHGPGLDAEEHERLRRLLERGGSLAELNSELCQRIRSGPIDIADEDLIRHLRQTTRGKLSIDNPEYSGYRRALEVAGRGGGKGTRP